MKWLFFIVLALVVFSTGTFLQYGYNLPGEPWEYGGLFLLLFGTVFAVAHLPNTLDNKK